MRVADSPASPNVADRHKRWAARWDWLVSAAATIVMERKHGEVSTDYRTFPIHVLSAITGGIPIYATVPVDEVWRAGVVLKLYVWSHKGDSLAVRGLRVRMAFEALDRW